MWDLTVTYDHDFYVIPTENDHSRDLGSANYALSDAMAVLVHNCGKNQGVYIFDDLTQPGKVYIGKTNNFAVRFASHIRDGRLADAADAICVHICGDDQALRISEHIFKTNFQDMGMELASPIERYGERLYNEREAKFVQLELPFDK